MTSLKPHVRISYTGELRLSESELRALDALAGYGTNEFLDIFYTHMGRAYLEPYEEGLRALFDQIRGEGRRQLGVIDSARKVLDDAAIRRVTKDTE